MPTFNYSTADRVVMASIPPHGQFAMLTDDVDRLIKRYRYNSIQELRAILSDLCEDNGMDTLTYHNVKTRFEFIMILGEFEGKGL